MTCHLALSRSAQSRSVVLLQCNNLAHDLPPRAIALGVISQRCAASVQQPRPRPATSRYRARRKLAALCCFSATTSPTTCHLALSRSAQARSVVLLQCNNLAHDLPPRAIALGAISQRCAASVQQPRPRPATSRYRARRNLAALCCFSATTSPTTCHLALSRSAQSRSVVLLQCNNLAHDLPPRAIALGAISQRCAASVQQPRPRPATSRYRARRNL